MPGWKWLKDNVLDRTKLKRTLRILRRSSLERRRLLQEAIDRGASKEERDEIVDRWLSEHSMLFDDYQVALTNHVISEANKRHIPVPSEYESQSQWRQTWDGEDVLTSSALRRLQLRVRKESQAEWHLRLQVISVIGGIAIGVLGTATALFAILLQLR